MEEIEVYDGTLSGEAYRAVEEAVDAPTHQWRDADVNLILERNDDNRLRVEGPETRSILTPWRTGSAVSETYPLDDEAADYLEENLL